MAKLKEGAVIEGLFAMYCACFLIDPNDGASASSMKTVINSMRVQTELREMATKGKYSVDLHKIYPEDRTFENAFGTQIVTGKQAKQLVRPPSRRAIVDKHLVDNKKYFVTQGVVHPDFSTVELKIRLKEAEVGSQYGNEVKALVQEEISSGKTANKNYEGIRLKIDTLVKAKSGIFFDKLVRAKQLYVKNKRTDVIHYVVDADGTGGESTAGEVKQDITITITANGRRILKENVNFSLKSETSTFHNAGLKKAMDEVYEIFKGYLSGQTAKDAQQLLKSIRDFKPTNHVDKVSVNTLWRLILSQIPNSPDTSKSDYWWSVLEKQAFGTGYTGSIQMLELNRNEIRELTPDYIADLKNVGNIKLFPVFSRSEEGSSTPGSVVLMPKYKDGSIETDARKCIYKMRIRYSNKKGQPQPVKMMSELGGKESLIHEEKFDNFLTEGKV